MSYQQGIPHDLRRRLIPWLASLGRSFTAPGVARHFDVSPRTARRVINQLWTDGLIVDVGETDTKKTGTKATTIYESAISWRSAEEAACDAA